MRRMAWLLALWLVPGVAPALEIRDAGHLWMDDTTLLARLDLDMALPEVLVDALENGVTLGFRLEAQAEPDRWLPGRPLARAEQRVQLSYFPLNRHYLVTSRDGERRELRPTLGDALEQSARRLGRVHLEGLPEELREAPEGFRLNARLSLDYTALPLPLQLDAGLRGELTARQEWYGWSLD
ncbi:DUF4390 domain-containing protein [Thioalkalivibrio sp. ALJ24]|uniref:DUF4390 domain-containing protein n=1 Tax=Thioalkalivibrio sp. ALJ24 TaxID=545276 RepID=UPI00036FEBF3|nr:DUF4390 domain-containing protein [Thioalkalivibrio sp. ALJ24]